MEGKKIKLIRSLPNIEEYLVKQNGKFYSEVTITAKRYRLSELVKDFEKLTSINHPNIVKVISIILQEDKNKIVMTSEYYEKNLLQEVKANNKYYFTEASVLSTFSQIFLGLKELYDNNIIHRYLSLADIYRIGSTVKIGGLFFVQLLKGKNDYSVNIIEKNDFVSPEMYLGKNYSFESDIWSLGSILYNYLTFKPLFDPKQPKNIIVFKQLNDESRILRAIPKSYSNELKSLLCSMLKPDPINRPTINKIISENFIRRYIKVPSISRDSSPYLVNNTEPSQRKEIPKHKIPKQKQIVIEKPSTRKNTNHLCLQDLYRPTMPSSKEEFIKDISITTSNTLINSKREEEVHERSPTLPTNKDKIPNGFERE